MIDCKGFLYPHQEECRASNVFIRVEGECRVFLGETGERVSE